MLDNPTFLSNTNLDPTLLQTHPWTSICHHMKNIFFFFFIVYYRVAHCLACYFLEFWYLPTRKLVFIFILILRENKKNWKKGKGPHLCCLWSQILHFLLPPRSLARSLSLTHPHYTMLLLHSFSDDGLRSPFHLLLRRSHHRRPLTSTSQPSPSPLRRHHTPSPLSPPSFHVPLSLHRCQSSSLPGFSISRYHHH